MLGQMQNWPLLVSKFLEHAELNHANQEIMSLLPEGGSFRYTYKDQGVRARQCAQALEKLGVSIGDRIATLAWNTHRHMELWFGISGIGAITHTVNPRLFPEQLIYIINHAADRMLFLDLTFVPLVEQIAEQLETVAHYVVLTSRDTMPETSLPGALCYEDLLEAESGDYSWPTFDENTACGLCYTSGTTGNPKGVLYSHRSNFLHTLVALSGDVLGIQAKSAVLPVVPMFHANSWGIPYAAAAAGAKLVMNGPHHEPEVLQKLIEDEGVTITAAVPTIWMGMLKYLDATGKGLASLETVTIGGAAAPRAMIKSFQDKYGVRVNHAWGMTETSPLGTIGSDSPATTGRSPEEKLDLQCKQGRAIIGVELSVQDDIGDVMPRDGKSAGHLMVRGPWVLDSYFGHTEKAVDKHDWFDTGDMATLDEFGYMQITDRAKDVIKSGGEWISSIDLENAAVAHPAVAEAAVIGVPHSKWDERPLLIIVPAGDERVSLTEMNAFLADKVAKWWLPDALEIVNEIPHTATGKISKKNLRETFKDYRLTE